ncbi:MAG: sulfatase-like hydrolase/transferase [Lentisphaeria bacterium]|nr:sulfatase-like hydrolase/transferase [Lentisphaeria bacterium]
MSRDGVPNILFFLPDQHRWDWTGLNPELPLRTPNLVRLAARGAVFRHAITPSPLCAPARACLASGRDYDRCRVPDNHSNYPLDQPTYYQALRRGGYRVAGVGKFDLHKDTRAPGAMDWGLDGSRLLPEWGFTEGIDNEGKMDGSASYRAAGRARGPYLAYLASRGLAETYVAEHAGMRRHMGAYVTALPEEAYCDNWLSDNGLLFLDGFPRDCPWHLVVNFTGPHNPMDVTARMHECWAEALLPGPHANEDRDREGLLRNRRHYAAMIENIDRQIGRFLARVEERGELANTLVVYASDHGEMLGDHGLWGKGTWRQAAVGIPLIVAGPGVREGVVREDPVSLHDLTATFLALAGQPPLPGMDAVDLRPALAGGDRPVRREVTSGLGDWRLAYDGRFKLVLRNTSPPLLFDLENDPWEEHDRRSDCPGRAAALAAAVERDCGGGWLAGAGGR